MQRFQSSFYLDYYYQTNDVKRQKKKRNYDDGIDDVVDGVGGVDDSGGVGDDVDDSCDCAIIAQQHDICIEINTHYSAVNTTFNSVTMVIRENTTPHQCN